MKFLLLFPVLFLCTVNSHPDRRREIKIKVENKAKECCTETSKERKDFQERYVKTCLKEKLISEFPSYKDKIEGNLGSFIEVLNEKGEIVPEDCEGDGKKAAEKSFKGMETLWERNVSK
ncbi:uncharacterized protein LOC111633464 [Centruroides sculpturatus]|uniref:uncharacterized protein LOC111633464 n=1 Tax=Centruroides sculpturatus TaxID=218467 RepID=UPI000C6CCBFF|nr:uncharacterized protein LOC111633464 [Centruroides sculpturatus]